VIAPRLCVEIMADLDAGEPSNEHGCHERQTRRVWHLGRSTSSHAMRAKAVHAVAWCRAHEAVLAVVDGAQGAGRRVGCAKSGRSAASKRRVHGRIGVDGRAARHWGTYCPNTAGCLALVAEHCGTRGLQRAPPTTVCVDLGGFTAASEAAQFWRPHLLRWPHVPGTCVAGFASKDGVVGLPPSRCCR